MQRDDHDCAGCACWTPVGTIGGRACGRCGVARPSFHQDGRLLSYCTPETFRCGEWQARAA
ncbi:MAG: hypothetical protein HYU60_01170 [Magnetospirillum sp.]|nr:hypothetical protein [Magnetospirillum sp.]